MVTRIFKSHPQTIYTSKISITKYNMAHSARQLKSREFKIMLQTKYFTNRMKGVKEISNRIERIVEEQGGKFKAPDKYKEEERTTSFLDTKTYQLYQKKKFLLRIRKEKEYGKYEVTLKCRHPDRYVCALYDLSVPEDIKDKFMDDFKSKFEEDIVTGKMTNGNATSISKFSLSATFKNKEKHDFLKNDTNIRDLVSFFPDLDLKDIDSNEPLIPVNNFEATEISSKIGTITFSGDATEIEPELNFWYSSAKEDEIRIIEFTFKCKAAKRDNDKDNDKDNDEGVLLEEYPEKLALGASQFYELLQKDEDIVDLDTQTKTDYAYYGSAKLRKNL